MSGIFLAILFTWPFFIPEIVSTYWHLRFGDSTTFHQWRVPVPKGWSAFSREGMFIIQKPTRFYDREDPPVIIPQVLNPSETIDLEALKQASIQLISKKGYTLQEQTAVRLGPDPGYCLLFASDKNPENISITCDSLAAKLSVAFFGPRSETETFYSVVAHIGSVDGGRVTQ